MGLYNEAKVYASVLGHNYSSNKWYNYSYSLFNSKKNNLLSNNSNEIEIAKMKDINNENKNSFLNILDEFINFFNSDEE